jgi:group I intron endonuclease
MSNYSNYSKKAGIYKLTCRDNGKIYIGKSVNIKSRLDNHKAASKRTNGRYYFEHALIKYGWDAFDVEILEFFDDFDKNDDNQKIKIIERESFYIKNCNSTDKSVGYNTCKLSTDRTGFKCSDETKKRMSIAQLGKKHSLETKEKMRGRKLSEEHKEKCRVANLGNTWSKETREKIMKSRKGYSHSKETREKISQSNKGKIWSEETREKIKQNKKEFNHSEESREKIRQGNLGQKRSQESRDNISRSLKGKKRKPWTPETREKIRLTKLKNKNVKSIQTKIEGCDICGTT